MEIFAEFIFSCNHKFMAYIRTESKFGRESDKLKRVKLVKQMYVYNEIKAIRFVSIKVMHQLSAEAKKKIIVNKLRRLPGA